MHDNKDDHSNLSKVKTEGLALMASLFSKLYIAQRTITAIPCVTMLGPDPSSSKESDAEKEAKLAAAVTANYSIFNALDDPTDQVSPVHFCSVPFTLILTFIFLFEVSLILIVTLIPILILVLFL